MCHLYIGAFLMMDEIDARLAAGEDFVLGVKANPYPRNCEAWRFYEEEYKELVNSEPEAVNNGSQQT